MGGARRSTATTGNKRARDHKNSASVAAVTEKPIFFSLDRARFDRVRERLQIVAVVVPLSHLQSKRAIFDVVLKKVLHKPFAENSTPATGASPSAMTRVLTHEDEEVAEATDTSAVAQPLPEKDKYAVDVVVHVDKMEVQADSARQVNAAGDVQLNVMTTLVVARVHHGLIVGASSPSDFSDCVTVTVPLETDKADVATETRSSDSQRASTDSPVEGKTQLISASPTLVITVRCLEDEPVVPGQSVFVVSEPGGTLRCLAVRPPRPAPGPFSLVAGGQPNDPYHTPASQVRIECDIPPTANQDGTKKRKTFDKKGDHARAV